MKIKPETGREVLLKVSGIKEERQRILKLIDKRIKYAEKESPENVKVMALNKFKKEIEPIEMLEFVKFVVAEELKAIKKQIKESVSK